MIGYNKVNFENLPSENTPISAENLDIMDQGIFDLDNAIEVNPASVATTDLESIRIDDTIYKIAGGHELVNSSGSTMTQRSKMEFLDTHLTDDSVNNTTKVEVVKEVTTAQFANETERGLYRITDKPDSVINAEQVAYGSGNVKSALDSISPFLPIKKVTVTGTTSSVGSLAIDNQNHNLVILGFSVIQPTSGSYLFYLGFWNKGNRYIHITDESHNPVANLSISFDIYYLEV